MPILAKFQPQILTTNISKNKTKNLFQRTPKNHLQSQHGAAATEPLRIQNTKNSF